MINLTARQIDKAKLLIGHIPKAVPKAMANSINRAAETARTEMSRGVRDQYYITVRDVRNTVTITKAKATSFPMAWVKSRGTRRPLIQFRVSPKNPRPKNPPVSIRVGVKKDGGLKSLPGAFVNKGKSSGMPHVLKRAGKSRYPIHIKYGPSIPEMIENPLVTKLVEQKATEKLEQRLDHEIDRVLEGK